MENLTKTSVSLPTSEKRLAFVKRVMSLVTVNLPNAPDPLACMRLSGMTSLSKWAIFSRNHASWSIIGPRGPAVNEFSALGTGAPFLLVRFL